jgi:hypothetical protein
MLLLQVAAGLFALVMLLRHLPPTIQAFRDRGEDRTGRVFVHGLNVLLALAILATAILVVAMKGLGSHPISR